MFKALNTQADKEIIILDREWLDRVNHLRALDRQDILVCPECKQPVRVRAGEIKRWHFAHKHLQDCPLQHESLQILQARALLYQWLVSKFESAAVTLEKKLDRDFLPRPVDCWVETKQDRFAYWIVEAQVKPQQRNAFLDGFDALGVNIHWVFLIRMLNENEESPGGIFLTTTEREFRQSSEYDQIGQSFSSHYPGFSLHYLDPDEGILTTYRSLHLIHEPQVYAGRKEKHALVDMLVLGFTGEFVHPSEYEQLQVWKEGKVEYEAKQKELEEKRRREQQEAEKQWKEFQRDDPSAFQVERLVPPRTPIQSKQDDPKPSGYTQVLSSKPKEEAVCELCGQVTSDWYAYDNKTKKCKCMDCYRRMSS